MIDFQQFTCALVMPSGQETLSNVGMVSLPGVSGRIGVLPRHAPMIVKLKPGIVSLDAMAGKQMHFFVWGGIAHLGPQAVQILTEAFTRLDDLDPIVLNQELTRYQSDLTGSSLEHDQAKLNYKIEIAQAMLAAIKANARSVS